MFWKTISLYHIFLIFGTSSGLAMDVRIDLQQPVAEKGPKFVGITVDTRYLVYGQMSALDLSSPKLHTLARALSPSYVRVGGTDADDMVFNATMNGWFNHTVGPSVLEKMWRLSQLAGWDLIFDLNVVVRKNGYWDPSNTREILKFFSQQGYVVDCFQLGNEPNVFEMKYNLTVSAQALAHDYLTLKSVLQEFPLYRNSCILGPEVTRITQTKTREYFIEFLKSGGAQALTAVGVHHYFCPGDPAVNLGFFTNGTLMDSLKEELDYLVSISRQYVPQLPVWLSETGTTFGSCPGTPDLDLTYINGFLWLDKLGLTSQSAVQHVNRQGFFSDLLDDNLDPRPEYYLTLLYKRLVQGAVFRVPTTTRNVRMYASCTNPDSYSKGALTVYVINIETIDVTLTLSEFKEQQLDLYMLTSGDPEDISSRSVALNGDELKMTGSELPPMPSRIVTGNSFTMAAKTFGFVVIPNANVPACRR
ncbi:heparanase-like [Littorina saxatilis]|uniref:Heparanase-like n=1 Tax=Littorina saxatilis TaxID=31220 RepID=A0AAN9AU73_9CAEN